MHYLESTTAIILLKPEYFKTVLFLERLNYVGKLLGIFSDSKYWYTYLISDSSETSVRG